MRTEQAIDEIIRINEQINGFWSDVDGWAPLIAAELLSKSRLIFKLIVNLYFFL